MKKLSLVILFAALSAVASASTLYPAIASWSLAGLASKTQRLIASGTLPAAGDAAEGELFLDTTTSPHVIYRKTGVAWVQAGGSGSGGGVTGTYRFPGLGDDGAEMAITYHNGLVAALTGINPDRTPRYLLIAEHLPGNVTTSGGFAWADTSRISPVDYGWMGDWGDVGTVNGSGAYVMIASTSDLLELTTGSFPMGAEGAIACRVTIPVATAGKFLFHSLDGVDHFSVQPLDSNGHIAFNIHGYKHECVASWPAAETTAVFTWNTAKNRARFWLDGVEQTLTRTATGTYEYILDDLVINSDDSGANGNDITLHWLRVWTYEVPSRTVAMLTPEPVRDGLVFEALAHNTNSILGYPVWEDSSLVATPATLVASGTAVFPEANASDTIYFSSGFGGLVATPGTSLPLAEFTVAFRAKAPAATANNLLSVASGGSDPWPVLALSNDGSVYFAPGVNYYSSAAGLNDDLMHTYVVAYSSSTASLTLHIDGVEKTMTDNGANPGTTQAAQLIFCDHASAGSSEVEWVRIYNRMLTPAEIARFPSTSHNSGYYLIDQE